MVEPIYGWQIYMKRTNFCQYKNVLELWAILKIWQEIAFHKLQTFEPDQQNLSIFRLFLNFWLISLNYCKMILLFKRAFDKLRINNGPNFIVV